MREMHFQGVEAAVSVLRPLCVRARGDDYMLEVAVPVQTCLSLIFVTCGPGSARYGVTLVRDHK
jgi:hypothetical protein